MPDTTPEREKARVIRDSYTAAAKGLRDNQDLTDEARRRLLAEEWKTARHKLDALQAQESTRLTKREQELERRVFGVGSLDGTEQAISTRDAQDRASRLKTPDEAAQLLARADRNGDKVLAQAVAHHAVQMGRGQPGHAANGWDDVLGAFFEARPHLATTVEELAQIERLGKRQVLNEFSLTQPHGVLPQEINAANPRMEATAP